MAWLRNGKADCRFALYGAKTTSEASVSRKWLSIVIVNDASQDNAS